MTVGKISAACWTFFVIMSLAFLPLGLGIMQLHTVPGGQAMSAAPVVRLRCRIITEMRRSRAMTNDNDLQPLVAAEFAALADLLDSATAARRAQPAGHRP